MTPYDCTAGDKYVGFEVYKRGQVPVANDFKIKDDNGGTQNWDDCPPYNISDDDSGNYSTGDYWVQFDFDETTYSATIYSDEWITVFDTLTGAKSSGDYTHLVAQTYKRIPITNTLNGYVDDVSLSWSNP